MSIPQFLPRLQLPQNLGDRKSFIRGLLVWFLGSVVLCSLILAQALSQQAQSEVAAKARLLSDTMSSARTYTQEQLTPVLDDFWETNFHPQSIPSYSAQEIFRELRKNATYADFFYKEAVLNPTNLRDKADEFETHLIQTLRQQPELKEITGFHHTSRGKLFYVAQPMSIASPSCLKCHSTPEVAPKPMVERYGRTNGFGWELNKTLGIRITYIPAQQISQIAIQSFFSNLGLSILVFSIGAISLYSFLLAKHRSFN
jgi:hypothetical protein